MPRELVHFEVLRAAAREAEARGASNVARIVNNNLESALLGAIAHDAPYYYRGGVHPFSRVANGLHGLAQSDTFYPLRCLADVLARTENVELREVGWAWVLGMFSHAIADQWFHPWVFFYSGDYYHPEPTRRADARRKHRLLEVYLDDWLSVIQAGGPSDPSVLTLVRALRGARLDFISSLLGRVLTERLFFVDGSAEDTSAKWRGALWESAILLEVFRSPWMGAVVHAAAKLRGSKWAEYEALVRWGRVGLGQKLEGHHRYRNPISGEWSEHTLAELLRGAIDDCVRVFMAMDSDLDSGVTPAVLRTLKGVSLNYGVWGAAPESATFFATEGLNLPQM